MISEVHTSLKYLCISTCLDFPCLVMLLPQGMLRYSLLSTQILMSVLLENISAATIVLTLLEDTTVLVLWDSKWERTSTLALVSECVCVCVCVCVSVCVWVCVRERE